LRFAEFELDQAGRQLLREGRAVRLSPKALALLRLLLERRPAALSKAEIRDHVWPETFVADSNLTSLVAELRTALADDARKPRFLRTVHGWGYAFCGAVSAPATPSRRAAVRFRLYYEEREIALADGETTLGRGDDVGALIDAGSVSRHHARIRVREGRATVEDLGSKNGTFVQGERVGEPRELRDRDEIRLGYVPLTFRVLRTSAVSTRTPSRSRR
jgi:DNA-binding winged helix-turn-helix (wHTH) protein